MFNQRKVAQMAAFLFDHGKGRMSYQVSLRRKVWRICFRWSDGHAYDVEIVDYHS